MGFWIFMFICNLLIPGVMIGWIMVPITVFPMLLLLGSGTDMTGIWGGIICILQCVVLVVSIYPVEKALRKNFDKNGKRKI